MFGHREVRRRQRLAAPFPDERSHRLFAANKGLALGYSGVTAAALSTGVARRTINRGIDAV